MSGVFISYRREDSRGDVGRLTGNLREYLDDGQIFRDIETLEPGVDFVKAIRDAVSACSVLIAVIGPNWLNAKDKSGLLRLEDPNDYVRLELEVALSRDIRVIPVLVGGAEMPPQEQLPTPLSSLAHRHAHELSETRWDFDIENLANILLKMPGIRSRKPTETNADKKPTERKKASVTSLGRFIGAAVLSTMGVLFLLAGVIEGQALAFIWAAAFLGGAYWLYTRK